ncbi:MAG: pyruvate:ferredoxin (flavodoxin) oxidoreductase [Oscillospiraceae bacterium]|nr:pyruvate:ferredoxin (flavodoxin) oxidoreductase [Oscillospiraceae bacterium]
MAKKTKKLTRALKTMDGNTAAAHVAYAFTDVAGIYPITPSSNMAEYADIWAAEGRKNLFGQTVRVIEMQSEAGAVATCHGAISAGTMTTTFTASQGLLLMIPNMFKIAGELTPNVLHVSARTVATHALSIFGDHSDVMSVRSTGYALLANNSVQEVMDLAAVAHLSTITGRVPVLNFFDGFRTSHEMQKIETWDYEDFADMVDWDAIWHFRKTQNNPNHPVLKGSAENPDTFFQHREASNKTYNDFPKIVESYMNKVNEKIGTDYKLFNYYGAKDATEVIICMGSVCETAEEVVDYLNANGGKVGMIKVRLYRPFSVKHLLDVIPASVQKISVLDRTKEPGAHGEPLYLDVIAALKGTKFDQIPIYGGRYGLASKDTPPGAIVSVFRNLQAKKPKNGFTVGIEDDVTGLSLPIKEFPITAAKSTVSCKFWGIGGDGTVGANKNTVKILGDYAGKQVQAYFQYDSKKSGGVTRSHIRFGDEPIRSTYFVTRDADFVGCHVPSYIERYDMASELRPGGTFLVNCNWDVEELGKHLSAAQKKFIATNNIKVYTCDAVRIAKELELGSRINTILQAAFFMLNPSLIATKDAVKHMKEAVLEDYGSKGDKVVKKNYAAIEAGVDPKNVIELKIPASWKKPEPDAPKAKVEGDRKDLVEFVEKILFPIAATKGDDLPVSTFVQDRYSTFPQGSAAYEKRGIAVEAPVWIPENCIQCNQCVYVCPHSILRPYVLNEKEVKAAPAGFQAIPLAGAKGGEGLSYALGASVMDCMGAPSCGSCANVCPAKQKAIVMKPLAETLEQQPYFDYCDKKVTEKDLSKFGPAFQTNTVKGSQFLRPLLEFHGACAGCGETPYANLITQLFGERMYIVNATGCSSIWGGTYSQTPYTVNKDGQGPAWLNSLFEDTAEAGLGVYFGAKQQRERAKMVAEQVVAEKVDDKVVKAAKEWLKAYEDGKASNTTGKALEAALKAAIDGGNKSNLLKELYASSNQFMKPSTWMFGGDGWAYDIGYGGLDHVIASGENVNMLVFDTEIYSNTGGQASKASQMGQVAQFAAAGKPVRKKDLAQIAMAYGYVYVAQIAMGADYNQTLKAILEAEAYDGPSIVIAYSPCISHGNKNGMGSAIATTKHAVECGYWHNFRFNPDLAAEGKNPLIIDSKAPTKSYGEFLKNEVRYTSLERAFPERAAELFATAEILAKEKWELLNMQKEMFDKKYGVK